jgi:tetratricopeptide (TPR) repeat protein
VNVFFHASAAVLLFFALRRLFDLAVPEGREYRNMLPVFGAAVFLLHPVQTEAVSYVAQRGEDLGALLYYAAFCVFLYRKPGAVTWPRAMAVTALYGAAVVTKEHTVTLPALLLLTDYFFHPGYSIEGVKRNWRVYLLMAIGFALGMALVWSYLRNDTGSVGFRLQEFTPAQYLFTEFRVFFAYIGLFVYPLWQTIDYDFAVSKSLLDQGAIVALAALVGLAAAAIFYRRRYPLACYGFFAFGLMLLPTSSIVPIRDPIADRRLYLPMFGLLLISMEFLRRVPVSRRALGAMLAGVCVLLAIGSYRRNELWSNAVALWADAAEKNPQKPRVQFGLASAEFLAGDCHDAIPHYERAIALSPADYQLDLDLGMAYQCDKQLARALTWARRSTEVKLSAQGLASLAIIEAQQGMMNESLADLDRAEKQDPTYVLIYLYRGNVYQAAGRTADAMGQFRRVLELDPGNATAKNAMEVLSGR